MSEQNPKNHTDHMWKIHMKTLTKRKRNLQIAQTIDEAINEYYSIQGKPVPNWRYIKDQDWWIDYLESLGMDPRNP
jgi:hypothetical protein